MGPEEENGRKPWKTEKLHKVSEKHELVNQKIRFLS